MPKDNLHGFNTTLQQVDERYAWINDMIKARQELVLQYMKLLNLPLPNQDKSAIAQCYLIDYVSHGHFDLYPKIISLIENASGRSLSIAHRVLPKIEETTEFLMRFNDRYAENMDESKLKTLKQDLSTVGRCLEQRFKNEDRLIIGLRLVHSIVSGKFN